MGLSQCKEGHRYSLEFKRQAVNLSPLENVEVRAVAAALDIRPPFVAVT